MTTPETTHQPAIDVAFRGLHEVMEMLGEALVGDHPRRCRKDSCTAYLGLPHLIEECAAEAAESKKVSP